MPLVVEVRGRIRAGTGWLLQQTIVPVHRTGHATTPLRALAALVLALAPLDLPSAHAAPVTITCSGLPATVVGTSGDDQLAGTPGRDVIAGLGGNDRINARGGDDVVCGGDGFDVLLGGRGDDQLYGGRNGTGLPFDAAARSNVGDVVTGGAGDDLLVPGRDPRARIDGRQGGFETLDVISFASARRGVVVDLERGTARGQGRDTIVAGPVQVLATPYDDVLHAGRASVRLVSGSGDDVLVGSRRDDLLEPDAATTSFPSLRRDPRIGRGGDDVVRGRGGDDRLFGRAGADLLDSGADDDLVVAAGTAPVRVVAGTGSDRVFVSFLRRLDGLRVGVVPDGRDSIDLDLQRVTGASPTWDLATGRLTTPDGASADVDGAPRVLLGLADGETATITGTPRRESVAIEGGTATFAGLGGDDVFAGYSRSDTFDGGAGTDTFRSDVGSPRSNACVSVERDPARACERR